MQPKAELDFLVGSVKLCQWFASYIGCGQAMAAILLLLVRRILGWMWRWRIISELGQKSIRFAMYSWFVSFVGLRLHTWWYVPLSQKGKTWTAGTNSVWFTKIGFKQIPSSGRVWVSFGDWRPQSWVNILRLWNDLFSVGCKDITEGRICFCILFMVPKFNFYMFYCNIESPGE